MSVLRTRIPFLFKVMLLPLVACAVVGADNLVRNGYFNQEDDGLRETLSAHYIQLESGNMFRGRITGINDFDETVGIAGLQVMLVQRSQKIHTVTTGTDGEFEVPNVSPGTYSFCVAGQNGFLAHGVHFLAAGEAEDISAENFEFNTSWSAPTQITAAVLPPEFSALRQIMAQSLPGSTAAFGLAEDSVRINVEKSVIAGGFQVALSDDGTMQGRIAPIASDFASPIRVADMNVFLIVDDEIYTRAVVEADGSFEFEDVEPGVYGFAAAGKDGFAAISFQAVEPSSDTLAATGGDTFQLTSAAKPAFAGILEVALCPPEDSPFLLEQVNDLVNPVEELGPPPAQDPLVGDFIPNASGPVTQGFAPGGSFGTPTTSFGGGGGGFGGGGFGGGGGGILTRPLRWAGLAGAILGIVALADDDSTTTTPTPVSPAN